MHVTANSTPFCLRLIGVNLSYCCFINALMNQNHFEDGNFDLLQVVSVSKATA